MKQLYKVVLTTAQRTELQQIVRKGKTNAHVFIHAHCLLKADASPRPTDLQIGTELGISYRTVMRVRQRFCQGGLKAALYEKAKSGAPKRITGKQKAAIVALTCTAPPAGYARWTLRLLADKAVELEIVETISHVSIGEILKKTN